MDKLRTITLIWYAFSGRDIAFYPREMDTTIEADKILARISDELKNVDPNQNISEEHLKLARESLDEVKSLTEYQDEKTARLLTIVAFLTAASGVVFSRVLFTYPLHEVLARNSLIDSILVCCAYVIFGIFLLFVVMGVLLSFYAMQTRFIWKEESVEASGKRVKSFLFFRNIIATKPEAWAQGFLDANDNTKVNPRLQNAYYKNYIAEAYLIAAKVADKVTFLEPAQNLLLISIRLLIVWVLSLALVIAVIPNSSKSASDMNKLEISSKIPSTISFPNVSHIEIHPSDIGIGCVPTGQSASTAPKPHINKEKSNTKKGPCH